MTVSTPTTLITANRGIYTDTREAIQEREAIVEALAVSTHEVSLASEENVQWGTEHEPYMCKHWPCIRSHRELVIRSLQHSHSRSLPCTTQLT